MPTYKFRCDDCRDMWEERQPVKLTGGSHTAKCKGCGKECNSISFGGTGTLLKGRHMNKYLEGFPDQTNRINTAADKEAVEMEREYDAHIGKQTKK